MLIKCFDGWHRSVSYTHLNLTPTGYVRQFSALSAAPFAAEPVAGGGDGAGDPCRALKNAFLI